MVYSSVKFTGMKMNTPSCATLGNMINQWMEGGTVLNFRQPLSDKVVLLSFIWNTIDNNWGLNFDSV